VSIYLPTVISIHYSSVFCVNKSSHSFQYKVFLSILCRKIYLHTILRNTVCSTLGRFIYTKYCTLNTVGRFIYTKYWGILYVEHCGKIYLHKILRNTVCCTLLQYSSVLFVNKSSHSAEHEVFLSVLCQYIFPRVSAFTIGRFIYTIKWGILYVEHCGKIYLHKIARNTVCSTLGRFIYTKYWGLLYVEHCRKIYLHKILRN
jgi:hypothetical protein